MAKYFAAVAAFVIAYVGVSFAYAEPAPIELTSFFRNRQPLLGLTLILICLLTFCVVFVTVS
jgi:hypothetical protein